MLINKTIKLSKLFIIIFLVIIYLPEKSMAEEKEGSVFFNEILWSGSFVSASDEFIELKNNSLENIDLSGWQITKLNSNGTEELMLEIPEGIIPAGGYFLIANSEKNHPFSNGESILNIDPDVVNSSVSLSNDKFQIKIYKGDYQHSGDPIDIAGDGKEPFSGSNAEKISMERIMPLNDGTQKENWQQSNSSMNLDEYSSELATPQSSGKPKIIHSDCSNSEIIINNKLQNITFSAEIFDINGPIDIDRVEIDLNEIELSKRYLNDLGLEGDDLPDDGIYKSEIIINSNEITAGKKQIKITAYDKKGLIDETIIELNFYDLSEEAIINETLPNPENGPENEFIELYNNSNKDIDLFGWQLDDIENGGSSPFKIKDSFIISAYGYQVLYKKDSKLALNDTGDTVRLINPLGKEIQRVTFGKSNKNFSYNLIDGTWLWSSTPTPGSINIITSNTDNNDSIITISKAKETKLNTKVTVVGIVTSIPGMHSNNYYYIQDDTGGIQVYSSKKTFPNINIGDKIQIIGKTSYTSKGYRIKTYSISDFKIISTGNELLPKIINSETFNTTLEGMLVQIKGTVTRKVGNIIYINNGTSEVRINFKSQTGIIKPKLKKGDYLEIIGIAVLYKDTLEILPRFQADIVRYYLYSKSSTKSNNNKINLISVHKSTPKYNSFFKKQNLHEADYSLITKKSTMIKLLELMISSSICFFGIFIKEAYAKK